LNGIRRTPAEIKRFAEDTNSLVLVGDFKDDLTNYGLTTVIGGRFEGGSFKVEIWVMSCRTFDRYLEHTMLLALQREIATKSISSFFLDFKRTARNEYFVGTGVALGLFDKSIADGTCLVDIEMPVIPSELPMKVVFS
jgi:hypothetical protein